MGRDRFFIAGKFAVGERVTLSEPDARKIMTVLRRHTGDRIELVDSAGTVFEAVLGVAASSVEATLERAAAPTLRVEARIVLAQAIPKGQKMDFIVEKATELGIAAIVPLRSARVIGERTGENKVERWERIARSAAGQSGRRSIPAIEPIVDWAHLVPTFAAYERVYVAWERAAGSLRERFEAEAGGAVSILLIIGPEGGFAADEIAVAQAAGAVPIGLGALILRTETAALVALSALRYARGEL